MKGISSILDFLPGDLIKLRLDPTKKDRYEELCRVISVEQGVGGFGRGRFSGMCKSFISVIYIGSNDTIAFTLLTDLLGCTSDLGCYNICEIIESPLRDYESEEEDLCSPCSSKRCLGCGRCERRKHIVPRIGCDAIWLDQKGTLCSVRRISFNNNDQILWPNLLKRGLSEKEVFDALEIELSDWQVIVKETNLQYHVIRNGIYGKD